VIAPVASGPDSNAAGASLFVGIPRPVGVADGDLVVAAIAVPAGIQVTPPSSDWLEAAAQTDPARPIGLAVFWTTALNAPRNWVFSLSAAAEAEGLVVVYRNPDPFHPIEVTAAATTAAAAAHAVAGISASLDGEELLVFLAADAAGSYTPAAGFVPFGARVQTSHTLEAHRRQLQTAGARPAFNVAFSGAADGVSLVLVIAPSYGTLSFDDARERLISAMPEGLDGLLDFTVGGDFYRLFSAIGALMKIHVFDLVDLVRQEIVPYLSRYKLPKWEEAFALLPTRTAQFGTIPQRQAQVLGSWRAAAGQGSSIPVAQQILATLLGYNPTTPVQIIESDAGELYLEHSHGITADVALPAGVTTSIPMVVDEGGKLSQAGVRLRLVLSTGALQQYTFTLRAPNGTSKTWDRGWDSTPLVLYGIEFADLALVPGIWTLDIFNGSGAPATLFAGPLLELDGIARNQDTGGAIFWWGVYADPLHLGENGVAPTSTARAS
jgi:hypothetical protein